MAAEALAHAPVQNESSVAGVQVVGDASDSSRDKAGEADSRAPTFLYGCPRCKMAVGSLPRRTAR